MKLIAFGVVASLLATAALAATTVPAADPRRGELAYQKCYSCHSLEPGKNDLSGPSLHGVIGRSIASQPGFDYSPALRRLAQRKRRWSPALLDAYIADPERVAPGTAMTFVGMRSAKERADLLTYLRSVGNDPKR